MKITDTDITALKQARKALMKSSSREMLRANIAFLVDYFITHPSKQLPEHLQPKQQTGIPPRAAH